jgi:hypothetical protein
MPASVQLPEEDSRTEIHYRLPGLECAARAGDVLHDSTDFTQPYDVTWVQLV